jgi:sugar phosphate isomerase/epimerase
MKLSIVLSIDAAKFDAVVYKGTVYDNIAQIADLGYDGVELAVRDPAQLDVNAIKRVLAKHDLRVPAIGTGQAYGEDGLSFTDVKEQVREAAVARITNHIRLGADLEAVVILGLIRGVTPPDVGQAQAMSWLVQALQKCAEMASKLNVKLAIEPINRYETDLINTIEQGMALLQRVGADGQVLGLLPDTFHMNIEEPSIAASLRMAAPSIFHFHVADSNRWHPGAGHLDFRRILSVLIELDYQGWVSAETLPYPDPETAAEQGLAHLRNCLVGAID